MTDHKYDHARERFEQAIRALATLDGPLQGKRLESAALALIDLHPEEFPSELRDAFLSIDRDLTKHAAENEGEGSIKATLRKMSNDEASDIARRMADVYLRLHDK